MLSKLIPILFLVLGVGGGIATAHLLTAPEKGDNSAAVDGDHDPKHEDKHEDATKEDEDHDAKQVEYVRLNNQFVVPIVEKDKVSSLVVLSLSLEITPSIRDSVFEKEPKLRDEFLQVFFDHANTGGFSGNFTRVESLTHLKNALHEVARNQLGNDVLGVLIESIARQDV